MVDVEEAEERFGEESGRTANEVRATPCPLHRGGGREHTGQPPPPPPRMGWPGRWGREGEGGCTVGGASMHQTGDHPASPWSDRTHLQVSSQLRDPKRVAGQNLPQRESRLPASPLRHLLPSGRCCGRAQRAGRGAEGGRRGAFRPEGPAIATPPRGWLKCEGGRTTDAYNSI